VAGRKRGDEEKKAPAGGDVPSSSASAPSSTTTTKGVENISSSTSNIDIKEDFVDIDEDVTDDAVDAETIKDVANFSFDGVIDTAGPPPSETSTGRDAPEVEAVQKEDGAIPLPDIKDTLRRKEMEAEMARIEEEETATKKIDRKDRKALLKLLEQQPYADADDSFFEEEEYTTVSALLGERAKPFLGIPTGPLQVGHFIGALVIVLMAFIEYPGFPLTNLPSPLRGALQGGLGTVYAINAVLAVLAVFKAGERGQPAPLWIAKVFSVGGLAYDQLTQLPTLEQIEKAKAQKGKRALRNKTKNKY